MGSSWSIILKLEGRGVKVQRCEFNKGHMRCAELQLGELTNYSSTLRVVIIINEFLTLEEIFRNNVFYRVISTNYLIETYLLYVSVTFTSTHSGRKLHVVVVVVVIC